MVTNNTRRMSPAELRETCYAAAATAVVSHALGYGFSDIVVHNDCSPWPTTTSDVDTALWPIGMAGYVALRDVATIYEVAGLASRKVRGLGSHRISLIDDSLGRVTLDDPKIWAAIETLAAHLEGPGQGDEGFHGALATFDGEPAALKLLTDAGLHPRYWADEGSAAVRARFEAMYPSLTEF
jgi:hypothetical protein